MVYNDYKDWGWEPFVRSWIGNSSTPPHSLRQVVLLQLLKNRREKNSRKLFGTISPCT